jgi:alginate O-acetyltransferase complex protein AlgJ
MKKSNIIFAGLLAVWGMSSTFITVNALGTAASPDLRSIINGSAAAAFEKKYRDQTFFRQVALDSFGSLRYLAFGAGRKGVVVGDNDWLHIASLVAVRSELDRVGAKLVIALIPEKADIYAEKLDKNASVALNYENILNQLVAKGFSVPDLRYVFLQQKSQQQLFLRTDTHWTPEGAQVAARALGKELGKIGNTEYVLTPSGTKKIEGDLTHYISIGYLSARKNFATETINQFALSEKANATADIFESSAIPVALVGTSYSANENWGFESSLKTVLQSDVLNVAEVGKGPFEPMKNFLSGEKYKSEPPKYLIWEIPLRYFAVGPESTIVPSQGAVLSASVTP